MSAQFITHDEFETGQDRLFMRLTRFITGQVELIRTQITARIDTLERNMNERFDKLDGSMSDLEAAQTALKAATEGYARDTNKQLADSHAALMEQINHLKRPPEK